MSVEKAGPKGYEYQYLVSVFIALELICKDNIKIFIESENGEDLQVQFDENERTYIIDIQVKKRDQQIDLIEFSKWISHFEDRSSDKNLFTKLHSEKDRFVLYVTNSRCKDEVSNFVAGNIPINEALEAGISDELLQNIKINTLSNYSLTKKLSEKRHDFLKMYFSQLKNKELRSILKKYKIWDLQDADRIRGKISRILNQEFFVPQSKISTTILKLIEIIKLGRDTNDSISSNIVELLAKYKGTRVFEYDDNLVNRTEKKDCQQTLLSSHVLLLTGVSFCGKTYLAKEIAQEYQDKGFAVKVTNELRGDNGGLAFLRHTSPEDRLLVLEDPFGDVITNERAIEIVSDVKKLIKNSDLHRKIIITTRKDILLDAMRKDSLNECSINTNIWFDLTVENVYFGKAMWQKYFGESNDSLRIFNKIREWLEGNEKTKFLQPGQIDHLYRTQSSISELGKMDVDSIVNLARVDSDELAHKIELRGVNCKKLYIALGLSCNTYKYIHLDHLAFILSDLEETPSIKYEPENDFSVEYSFSEKEEEFKYPNYSRNSAINPDYIEELKYLKNHGYIKIDSHIKTVIFTHPIYHFASKILFQSSIDDLFESDELLKLVNRSLGALSKGANICTLMMLESYYAKKKNQVIKSLMLKSLHSIYPSVRDRVIMFFDSRVNELSEEEGEEFVNFVGYLKTVSDDVLLWKDGDPYFNILNKRSLFGSGFCKNDDEYIASIQEKIEKREILSSEEMWAILNSSIVANKNAISLEILRQCLTYDEVFIREKAIFHLFEDYAFDFNDITEYLDYQEHPNVIYKLFRGALNSWNKYKYSSQQEIIDFYKSSLNVVSVAIRSLRFLENFEDQHITDGINWPKLNNSETKELWLVWYDVFIELLNKFPSKYIVMNEPHMVTVASASLKYVTDKERIINFTAAWMNWLDKYSERYLAKDYGMSVAEYLMEGTKENFELRRGVFKSLLNSPKTSFITTNIKTLIDYWDYLSQVEKQLLLDLLNSERKDLRWLRAVALNRNQVPREVQIGIFGEALFEKNTDEILDKLIKYELLEYCINIHCGFPQPLWWNGYHHNNYKLWDKIIMEIISGDNYSRVFQISLREFIDSLYNHSATRFLDGDKILTENLLSDEKKRSFVFERLLAETITQNQENKQLWDLLFANSNINEQKKYLDKIVKYIEAVQFYHTGEMDLYCIFDKAIIYNEIYPRIEEDSAICKFCTIQLRYYEFEEELGDERSEIHQKIISLFKIYIKMAYDSKPPRMSLTNKIVLNTMMKLKIEDKEIEEKIKQISKNQSNVRKELAKDFDDHYEIENWIY
ncbi:hypothetical protein ACS2QR_03415 [Bacillus cereus group sp. Bce026]|uniref:nSTAND3 domain-containing NTPase n=1 Tax=Bacillus cereus group sp. Bce026 TaxID=3445242 RepID=UPI003F27ECD3